jgi:hypothetical protein
VLRQLARLGRSVPFAGPGALAIAVYSDNLDQPVRAQQAGYEGVACVDDAARALELYCDLWEATEAPWARRWCEGLLDFILAMQDADGRWLNFILDWDGAPNHEARTSIAGGAFWQARALLALARAAQVLDDVRIDGALERGLAHIREADEVPSDVRALHIRTALTLLQTGDDRRLGAEVGVWSGEVAGCRDGEVLMNSRAESGPPHLWAHIQEGVLADAGVWLGRPDLVAVASRSAELVFRRIVVSGFDLPRTQPYDVASAVYVLTRVGEVTGTPAYAALAAVARSWFDGRNGAGVAVYDRQAGRVGDGVEEGRVSRNSGAEANIVGAQALFDDAVLLARELTDAQALPAGAGDRPWTSPPALENRSLR